MAPPPADDPTRSLGPNQRGELGAPRREEDDDAWEERLLGFDARVTAAEAWPEERRSEFLLRPEVPQPCSADHLVWRSLFDAPGQQRPDYVGFFGDLWEDLAQLQAHLAASPPATPPTLVAVTVLARQAAWTGRSPLAPVLGGRVFDAFSGLPLPLPYARPATRRRTWPLLGYDVADVAGQSGLANCRFDAVLERNEAQQQFGPRLNLRHLFDHPDTADAFRHACDQRVPAHAPFFVYGLWLVP